VRPDDVDRNVAERIANGEWDARLRSQMQYDSCAPTAEQGSELGARHVTSLQPGRIRDVLSVPGREVVQDKDGEALGHESIHQVAADETRSSGDDCARPPRWMAARAREDCRWHVLPLRGGAP
jgi:hypothetical protein